VEALKLHKLQAPITKDKDGDDGGSPICSVIVERVDNGYIVVWINSDGDEIKEVYNEREELLSQLKTFI
jgi:hypothetical protein